MDNVNTILRERLEELKSELKAILTTELKENDPVSYYLLQTTINTYFGVNPYSNVYETGKTEVVK